MKKPFLVSLITLIIVALAGSVWILHLFGGELTVVCDQIHYSGFFVETAAVERSGFLDVFCRKLNLAGFTVKRSGCQESIARLFVRIGQR